MTISGKIAEAVHQFCFSQERREDSLQMSVCFDSGARAIETILKAAFDLSTETYEGRPIVGGFLVVRNADVFLDQVKTWQVAILNLDVPDLSFRSLKNVAAVLTRDTWVIVCPATNGFRVIGLVRQRLAPLHEAQRGAVRIAAYEKPPLAISIEGPGILTVAVNHVIVAARRGDSVWTNQFPNPLIYAALWRAAGNWGDPGQTAAFFYGVQHEMKVQGRGGTIVIGPRVDTKDSSIIQPGAISVSGLTMSRVVMGEFQTNIWNLEAFQRNPLKIYREFELERRRGEELRDLLVAMTTADGAVLIDEDGEIYAYHAYFAVPPEPSNDPGEGSRHRSLRAFIKRTQAWLALAVSQDGTATVFAWDDSTRRIREMQSRYGMLLPSSLKSLGLPGS